MNEKELLEEMVSLQKKSNRRLVICAAAWGTVAAILLVCALILVPRAVSFFGESQQLVTDAQTSLVEIDRMVENTNVLLEKNTDAVTDVIREIGSVDFDSLNQSIKDFSEVISALAKITGIFK